METTIEQLIKDALIGKTIKANVYFEGEDWFTSSRGLGDDKLFTIKGVNRSSGVITQLRTDYGNLCLFSNDKFEIL